MELIFLKLGGSLITHKDKPFTERREAIERLAREIHGARQKKEISLLVGNGGGSYPHTAARNYQTAKGIINQDSYRGIVEVQDAAARLNRIIVRSLLDAGENAISIQPSSTCIAQDSRITEFYTKPLESILEKSMLPVIYGDVGIDIKQGCSILSTEELFVALVKKLKPQKIIMAGVVDGVFTADPLKDKNAQMIPEINPQNYPEIKQMLSGSMGIDVTGGMILKVERALELASAGAKVYIINGLIENRVKEALLGEKIGGTIVKA